MLKSFSWDQYFMTIAYLASMKSKDLRTRVGAVIVGPHNEIRATGYNGLPRGIMDRKSRYEDPDYRLYALNHAEENAILHCAKSGISTNGTKIYTLWMPCAHCTKAIIQAGIKEVIYDVNFPGNHENTLSENDKKSLDISRELLTEAEIHVRGFDEPLIGIEGLYKGQKFSCKI
jgi:dCMP deaminase